MYVLQDHNENAGYLVMQGTENTINQLYPRNSCCSFYYYEELTMSEIGDILAITESRVSQIHTKAILRLGGRLLKVLEKSMHQ